MGSRVQKIAFLIFALMFVAIMAVLNTSILTLGTSANNQLNTTISSTDVSLQIYDDTIVSGANVRDAAKNPDNVASTTLDIIVASKDTTDAGISTYTYNNLTATGHKYTGLSPYSASTSATAANYINPSATFDSTLLYNSNGVVVGIFFEQR